MFEFQPFIRLELLNPVILCSMSTVKALIELSTLQPVNGSDTDRLYQMFEQGATREEAATAFQEGGKSDVRFRVVLHKLTDRLINSIISGPLDQYTQVQRCHFRVLKRAMGANMLTLSGRKIPGVEIARETLKLAGRYGMISTALELSRMMQQYHAIFAPIPARMKHYTAKTIHFQEELNKEVDMERIFNLLGYNILKKRIALIWGKH